MAVTYSRTYRNGTKFYDLNLQSANVSTPNDVTAQVSASADIDFGDWYLFGVGTRLYIAGTYVGGADGYTTGSYQSCAACSGAINLPRRAGAYTVEIYLASASLTVGGIGPAGETTALSYPVTVPAAGVPSPPENLAYSRQSDNAVLLTWDASESYKTAVVVERRIDGGAWSTAASLAPDATSWTDGTVSADHAYMYRVKVTNGIFDSGYAESESVAVMTPAPPTKITLARSSSSGTDVSVVLENKSNTASYLAWEKREEGSGEWQTGGTIQGRVTSFTAESLGGVYRIRVRNVNATGASAWLVSETITTICPPNPPTLVNPSGVVSMAGGTVVFEWLHNTIDGSAQTAAQLRYKVGTGAWVTVDLDEEQRYEMQTSAFSVGASVTWQVRTKGVDDDFSEWSSTRRFNVYQVPSLSFAQGKPPATVTALPVPCEVGYTDPQGMPCASATVALYDGQFLMFSEAMEIDGNTLTASLSAGEFLPEDGKTYTVEVTARSGSTLQSRASTSFAVDYDPPKPATVEVTNDPDTGYATVLVKADNEAEGVDIVRIEVYRVTDHRQPVLVPATDGQSAVDKYAPLNTVYEYDVFTYAESGAFSVTTVANEIHTNRWFAYWGDNIAYAIWEPEEGGIGLSRPDKTLVKYAGRRDPVSYDGMAFNMTRSISLKLLSGERAAAFMKLMEDGGRGIFKGCDGSVFRADFGVTLIPELKRPNYYGGIDVEITRIAGGQL